MKAKTFHDLLVDIDYEKKRRADQAERIRRTVVFTAEEAEAMIAAAPAGKKELGKVLNKALADRGFEATTKVRVVNLGRKRGGRQV